MQLRHIYTGGCRVWSFSGRPDLKFKVQRIHRSIRFCITMTSILTGVTYTRVRLIVEILRVRTISQWVHAPTQ